MQAIANTMGVSVMAAYTIVNRIDDFACLPEQNIAHSMTSFMAQNSGAGKKERVRKGFWGGMKIELVYGMVIFLVCFFFAEPVVRLRHRCCKRGRHLSETDLIYVSAPGSYEWHTGIFPGNRRSEDHFDQ